MREGLLLRLQSEGWKIRRRSLASTWGKDLRSQEEQLGRCFVGWWGVAIASVPDLALLRRWGVRHWNLKGGVSFSNLGSGFFLGKI